MTARDIYVSHDLDVVGLGFRVKRETRVAIWKMMEDKAGIKGMRLVRELDNPADANAIAVYLPKRLMKGMQIGYLRRPTAEILAPKLDNGTLVVQSAVLAWLSAEDDYKEGSLAVIFKKVPKSS
jgi:HIRAN domain